MPKIPAAALTLEDTELLVRLAAAGKTTVELSLGARPARRVSGNAIAELRGGERFAAAELIVRSGPVSLGRDHLSFLRIRRKLSGPPGCSL